MRWSTTCNVTYEDYKTVFKTLGHTLVIDELHGYGLTLNNVQEML